MAGREQGVSLSRREAIKRMAFTLAGVVLAGCQKSPERKTGYELEREGDWLVDKQIPKEPDRTFRRVEFKYDPNRTGGSLLIQTCFAGNGQLRIVSYENTPRPGWLVDKAYDYQNNCLAKYPVTNLRVGDEEQVFVGVRETNQPPEQLYTNMRVYKIRRTDKGLMGNFLGWKTINPLEIKLRDTPHN